MKLPFDKVYCLHLAECKDRYEQCIDEFNRLGITDQVEFWWTCKRPISTKIGIMLKGLRTSYYNKACILNKDLYGAVFNCAFEHYTIIKQAYLRGLNSILIMEDDIKFIDDISIIEDAFNHLPDNYCCVKFHTGGSKWVNNGMQPPVDVNYEYLKDVVRKVSSTLCYCLDRNGMKKYIDSFDKEIRPSDLIFEKFIDDIYAINPNICHGFTCRSEIVPIRHYTFK